MPLPVRLVSKDGDWMMEEEAVCLSAAWKAAENAHPSLFASLV